MQQRSPNAAQPAPLDSQCSEIDNQASNFVLWIGFGLFVLQVFVAGATRYTIKYNTAKISHRPLYKR